jgi:hypothetical protein
MYQSPKGQGFSFQFCDVAKLVIIHKKDSAKFGYRPGMKVKRSKNSSHFGYMLEPNKEIWDRFLKRNCQKSGY